MLDDMCKDNRIEHVVRKRKLSLIKIDFLIVNERIDFLRLHNNDAVKFSRRREQLQVVEIDSPAAAEFENFSGIFYLSEKPPPGLIAYGKIQR